MYFRQAFAACSQPVRTLLKAANTVGISEYRRSAVCDDGREDGNAAHGQWIWYSTRSAKRLHSFCCMSRNRSNILLVLSCHFKMWQHSTLLGNDSEWGVLNDLCPSRLVTKQVFRYSGDIGCSAGERRRGQDERGDEPANGPAYTPTSGSGHQAYQQQADAAGGTCFPANAGGCSTARRPGHDRQRCLPQYIAPFSLFT